MGKTKLAILLAAILCLRVFATLAETPQEAWEGSPHADRESEGFAHWDEEDPAVVPAGCARCHSSAGFVDFLGADGTEAGAVDSDADLGADASGYACP